MAKNNPMFMPGLPNAGVQSRGWMPTNYAMTGIPDITGTGYAYEPGSQMASFLDGLNMTVSRASMGPNGQGSVVDWAKGLAQRAAIRKNGSGFSANAAGSAPGTGGGGMDVAAMMAQMQAMMAQIQSLRAQQRPAQNAQQRTFFA